VRPGTHLQPSRPHQSLTENENFLEAPFVRSTITETSVSWYIGSGFGARETGGLDRGHRRTRHIAETASSMMLKRPKTSRGDGRCMSTKADTGTVYGAIKVIGLHTNKKGRHWDWRHRLRGSCDVRR
jgi:hypothetical protein